MDALLIESSKLTAGSVTVDTRTQEVWSGDLKIGLSPKEYGLLVFLLRNRGNVQHRSAIIEHVWSGRNDLMFSQTVDVHIAYLRRKLGKHLIETVPGRGYLIPTSAHLS